MLDHKVARHGVEVGGSGRRGDVARPRLLARANLPHLERCLRHRCDDIKGAGIDLVLVDQGLAQVADPVLAVDGRGDVIAARNRAAVGEKSAVDAGEGREDNQYEDDQAEHRHGHARTKLRHERVGRRRLEDWRHVAEPAEEQVQHAEQ
ncbi:MAG: hypothetical protein AVDCRST_MAG26-4452 [uncultured Chloroflexia bacterium]|uniref:Uncharacterized protein n=1 Tax=uncultured Chloroflexia bacterium TaxID=1672391 RepID=A0A6J4K631_9CHLR|nr:MAG: hypothetical protein AVDCRST_MAG26-4452 [uncultured Chloroflexia bacterium]